MEWGRGVPGRRLAQTKAVGWEGAWLVCKGERRPRLMKGVRFEGLAEVRGQKPGNERCSSQEHVRGREKKKLQSTDGQRWRSALWVPSFYKYLLNEQ